MQERRTWRLVPVQYLSLGLLAVMLVLIIMSALANRREDGTRSLAGSYVARVEGEGGGETRLTIPSLLTKAGLSGDALVEVEIPVLLTEAEAPQAAVLVSQVRYAVELTWDGQLFGGVGHIGATSATGRSDASVLALVPEAGRTPGPHTLGMRLQGAWGEGGILGDVRVGDLGRLTSRLRRLDMQGFGLTMALWVLSIIQLMVLLRRPERREHLYFALFFASLATFWFTKTDAYYQFFDSLDVRLRLRRAAYMGSQAFALLWLSQYAWNRTGRFSRGFAAVCGALAAVALFTPDLRLNAWVNTAGDLLAVVLLAAVPATLFRAPPQDRVALLAMATAGLLSAAGVSMDIFLTRGVGPGGDWVAPVFLLVVVATASALSLKHSDAYARYASLLAAARDGVLVLDERGLVDHANPAARRLLGLRELDRNTDLATVLATDNRRSARRHVQDVIDNGEARAEFEVRQPTGTVWIESVGTRLSDGQVLLVLRDISDRRRVEEGLLRAAHMETVGVLAGGVGEDLAGVMASLRGQLGALEVRLGGDPDHLDRIGHLQEMVRHAGSLARRLQTLARAESSVHEPVDLNDVARTALALARSAISKDIQVDLHVEEGLPPVVGSAQDLVEVLVNLVVNASDAVPALGGRIALAIRSGESLNLGRVAEILVEDNGPGIPADRRSHVFDAFYSTKEGGRAGLGLTVVSQMVRAHGGEVKLDESALGGARFRVLLPVDPEVARVRAERKASRRVLLVDDEEAFLQVMREALSARGYQLVLATSHAQALERWRTVSGEIDLLVTDVLLGDGSGIDLAQELEKERPSLRVVIISGFVPRERVPQVMEGHWKLLDKPFRLEQLLAVVRDQLQVE